MILGENFEGLGQAFLVFFGMLALVALLSFIPSRRGHWLGLVLAVPVAAIGGLGLMPMIGNAKDIAGIAWLAVLTPTALGICSIGLWSERRRRRS